MKKFVPQRDEKSVFFQSSFFMQSCAQKVAVLNPANNQIISLSTLYTWSGCKEVTENGVTKVKCVGGRTFRSSRERWWFIAISRCDTGTTVSTCTNTHVDPGNLDPTHEVEIYNALAM